MMCGTQDVFEYFQCERCGCLQIASIPDDIGKYYASDYYSFRQVPRSLYKRLALPLLYRALVARSALQPTIHALVAHARWSNLRLIGRCRPRLQWHILDVGCGQGDLVSVLRRSGFRNAFGIDPYLPESTPVPECIYRQSLEDQQQHYDLIMFHHSFEHAPDPLQTLLAARNLLTNGGRCLIRIPTVSSWAWRHYREHWCQIDAPRHFHVHSIESVRLLADSARFQLEDVIYDSNAFQFWGSDSYLAGRSLLEATGGSGTPTHLTRSQIGELARRARELNLQRDGDQAAFFLTAC